MNKTPSCSPTLSWPPHPRRHGHWWHLHPARRRQSAGHSHMLLRIRHPRGARASGRGHRRPVSPLSDHVGIRRSGEGGQQPPARRLAPRRYFHQRSISPSLESVASSASAPLWRPRLAGQRHPTCTVGVSLVIKPGWRTSKRRPVVWHDSLSIADAPPATYDAASALCQRSLGGHTCGGGRPLQPPPTAHGRRKGAPPAHEGTLPPTRRPSPAPLAAGIGRLRDWEQWPVRDSSSRRRRCRHEGYWPRVARGEYREETGECVSSAARLHAESLATARVGEATCKYFFSRSVTLLGSLCVCFVSVFDCVISWYCCSLSAQCLMLGSVLVALACRNCCAFLFLGGAGKWESGFPGLLLAICALT